ncbi:MAG: Stk1 family PASTA domain-containing Ser/Thr kinase [Butyricicoccus sp.]|nr:Stk1 family PASTA domain-containing Ser/Thr kinase [Butyricicoccus sp.]
MDKYIGTVLGGRYEILDVLGVGGMAIVYKAYCRVLNRYVAIKMLKEEFSQDEEFRRRFYNESQAVAKLSHNNIVAIYDVVHSDGLDYIVMELIDGISLKEYLQKKGHLSWQETVFFAQQIARALEHAHSRGIIHQDIKPHNIMLLRDGTAKVTDFGIARLESNQETRVMQEAIGSVHYIAPEQAKGSPIDARADLYSLGVVMYEMLTGKLPFEGDSAVAIVMQHINSVPMMPSEIMPGIPKGMDDIVMHAMCPNVSKRYATAQELYNDLERLKQNPNVQFDYSLHDTRGAGALLDETRAISYERHPSAADMPRTSSSHRRSEEATQAAQGEEYAPRRPRKKKSKSPMALAGIVVGIIAVIAIVAGIFLIKPSGSEKIAVPNFVGMDIDQVLAEQDGKYADFYLAEADKREYDPKYKEGQIISQDPKEGEKVTKGTKIVLTVCGTKDDQENQEGYTLIDFSDMELSEVERLLKQNDLEDAYKIVEEASDEIEKGRVIRTDPGKGTKVTKDDTITIYVSTGKEQETVKVPDVTGMTLDKAKDMLKSYGLTVGETHNEESDSPVGQVFRQSIEEGTKVAEGSSVDLYISKGKTETTTEPDNNNQGGNSGTTSNSNEPSGSQTGTAEVPVTLPDTESCHVVIYLGNEKLADKTLPGGDVQVIQVTGPKGDQMLDVYIDGNKTSGTYTFN